MIGLHVDLIASLNLTVVVAFCTFALNISHCLILLDIVLFKFSSYVCILDFLKLTLSFLRKFICGLFTLTSY